MKRILWVIFAWLMSWPMAIVLAGQWPSLFRGVVVADSSLGVRIVSVEETSQAYLADLRPEDIIVRIDDHEVQTIDDFAAVSTTLKGHAATAMLHIFRSANPMTLTLHLYSYPLKEQWGINFLPDYDFRFAQASVGRDYWFRLGRGFEEADKDRQALESYLNGLHNLPDDVACGLKASLLFAELGQEALAQRALQEGLVSLSQGIVMMEHLFDYPLQEEQLRLIKEELQETLKSLKQVRSR